MGGNKTFGGAPLVMAMCLVSGMAWAEPPSSQQGKVVAAEPSAPAVPPDLVRLKNGGMIRGTISELVPNDYVVIIGLKGEEKRFSMTEVEYAGPASKDPASTAPVTDANAVKDSQPAEREYTEGPGSGNVRPDITIHAPEARVRFATEPNGYTFHKRTSSAIAFGAGGVAVGAGFREVCTAPCEVSLPAGSHIFALSKPGGFPVTAEQVALPPGASEIEGTYKDRSGIRLAGWLTMGAAVVAGGVLTVMSFGTETKCYPHGACVEMGAIDSGLLLGGLGTMLGGTVVGLVLASRPDGAEVRVSNDRGETPRAHSNIGGTRTPAIRFSGRF